MTLFDEKYMNSTSSLVLNKYACEEDGTLLFVCYIAVNTCTVCILGKAKINVIEIHNV